MATRKDRTLADGQPRDETGEQLSELIDALHKLAATWDEDADIFDRTAPRVGHPVDAGKLHGAAQSRRVAAEMVRSAIDKVLK